MSMNWAVEQITKTQETNTILSVKWSLTITFEDTQGVVHTLSNHGRKRLLEPDMESFTQYEQVTEAQVLDWLFMKIDKESEENFLITQKNIYLESLLQPQQEIEEKTTDFPWSS